MHEDRSCSNCGMDLEESDGELCKHCVREERDELRAATDPEVTAARNIHGGTDIEIDHDAKCAEGSEGLWVAAWVWVSNTDVGVRGND